MTPSATIKERNEKGEFPIIHPSEMHPNVNVEDSAEILFPAEGTDCVEMARFITDHKNVDLASKPTCPNAPQHM